MQHFLSFWASYSIAWPRCKKSFVSNNWCLVWTGSAFPQSFLSCKQSDAERKDFVGIPDQGHQITDDVKMWQEQKSGTQGDSRVCH